MKKPLFILALLICASVFSQKNIAIPNPGKSIITVKNFSFHPDFKECYAEHDGKYYPFKITNFTESYASSNNYTTWAQLQGSGIYTTLINSHKELTKANPSFNITIFGECIVDNKKVRKYFYFNYTDKDLFIMMKSLFEKDDKKGKLVLIWNDKNSVQLGEDIQLTDRNIIRTTASSNDAVYYLRSGSNLFGIE